MKTAERCLQVHYLNAYLICLKFKPNRTAESEYWFPLFQHKLWITSEKYFFSCKFLLKGSNDQKLAPDSFQPVFYVESISVTFSQFIELVFDLFAK